MPKTMKRRDVEKALRQAGCIPPIGKGKGPHDKWTCPCGKHLAMIPRHTHVSPGVIGSLINTVTCLPEGWLQ